MINDEMGLVQEEGGVYLFMVLVVGMRLSFLAGPRNDKGKGLWMRQYNNLWITLRKTPEGMDSGSEAGMTNKENGGSGIDRGVSIIGK